MPRQLSCFFAQSGMGMQRAAASLPGGNVDFNPILREHIHRGAIQM